MLSYRLPVLRSTVRVGFPGLDDSTMDAGGLPNTEACNILIFLSSIISVTTDTIIYQMHHAGQ